MFFHSLKGGSGVNSGSPLFFLRCGFKLALICVFFSFTVYQPASVKVSPEGFKMPLIDKLLFEDSVTENQIEFIRKVRTISDSLHIEPDWLMAVMYSESRINPQAVNKRTKATGLIQIMPRTAKRLKTTHRELYAMTNVEQLDYVWKYYKPYTGRITSPYDLYSITFYPAMIGKPKSWVLHTSTQSAAKVAEYNSGIDLNKDGKITVSEWHRVLDRKFKKYGLKF